MDADEATKKIREAAAAGRIEFAPQDGIEQMQEECDLLLKQVFDVEGAWVSDESSMSDFVSFFPSQDEREEEIAEAYFRVKELYGIDICEATHPFVIDVLREIVKSKNVGHC